MTLMVLMSDPPALDVRVQLPSTLPANCWGLGANRAGTAGTVRTKKDETDVKAPAGETGALSAD